MGYVDLMIFRDIWLEHFLIDNKQKGVDGFFFVKYRREGASPANQWFSHNYQCDVTS